MNDSRAILDIHAAPGGAVDDRSDRGSARAPCVARVACVACVELAAVAVGFAAALAGWPGSAHAHIAPAVDDNNRYLRVTPAADRVRLAYTVYIGEIPGARARRQMDANGDGALTDDETTSYRDALAAEVASGLALTVDGEPRAITWSEVDLGLGTPATNAGSFSIDLIAWICLPGPARSAGGAHRLHLRDGYALPKPGETELSVQESPGVKVTTSRAGPSGPSQIEFRWRGADTPLATRGWELAFEATAEAAKAAAATRAAPGDACRDPDAGGDGSTRSDASSGSRRVLAIATGVALAALVFAVIAWQRRRERS